MNAAVHDVAAQVDHTGNGEPLVVAEHPYLVKRTHVEGEHKVVDGDAERLAYLSEIRKQFLPDFATADARHVGGRRRRQREIMLVLDLTDVLVKPSRHFLLFGSEFGVDRVVAAAARLDVEVALAVEELVVVFGEFLHKIFEVAAVHTHMVDNHTQGRLPVLVEDRHFILHVAFHGNALADERVDVRLQIDAVAHGEDVVHRIILHLPVRVDDVAVEGTVQHGDLFRREHEHALQHVRVDGAVVILHAVHHSVIEIAEKILHLVPHFRFQCFAHIAPLSTVFGTVRAAIGDFSPSTSCSRTRPPCCICR